MHMPLKGTLHQRNNIPASRGQSHKAELVQPQLALKTCWGRLYILKSRAIILLRRNMPERSARVRCNIEFVLLAALSLQLPQLCRFVTARERGRYLPCHARKITWHEIRTRCCRGNCCYRTCNCRFDGPLIWSSIVYAHGRMAGLQQGHTVRVLRSKHDRIECYA
jgi:hypothetical protein